MIKHFSFDVWNTLIVANPHFAEARTKALAELITKHNRFDQFDEEDEEFMQVGSVEEYAALRYTECKRNLDETAINQGLAFTTAAIFEGLMDNLGVPLEEAVPFRATVERLFAMYTPKVTDEAKATFEYLRERGFSISIGSNSNFISGAVMNPFLRQQLGKFQFAAYSDLIGTSKPAPTFFRHVVDAASAVHVQDLFPDQIVHVGDHPICDMQGARRCGLTGLAVAQPDQLFAAVRSLVEGALQNA